VLVLMGKFRFCVGMIHSKLMLATDARTVPRVSKYSSNPSSSVIIRNKLTRRQEAWLESYEDTNCPNASPPMLSLNNSPVCDYEGDDSTRTKASMCTSDPTGNGTFGDVTRMLVPA
jgi:hypothetical protein